MERPDEHDNINTRGEAYLVVFFAEAGWEASKVKDYGRDFEVEVFLKQKTIGVLFNVQLKSTEQAAFSAAGDFISVELEMPNARYLAQELETPTILIQADVTQKRLFWSAPQTDAALLQTFSRHGPTEKPARSGSPRRTSLQRPRMSCSIP